MLVTSNSWGFRSFCLLWTNILTSDSCKITDLWLLIRKWQFLLQMVFCCNVVRSVTQKWTKLTNEIENHFFLQCSPVWCQICFGWYFSICYMKLKKVLTIWGTFCDTNEHLFCIQLAQRHSKLSHRQSWDFVILTHSALYDHAKSLFFLDDARHS